MIQTPKEIIEVELVYKDQFSKKKEFDKFIRYSDDLLPNMYDHNLTYIKQGVSKEHIHSIIKKELHYRKQQKHTFLQIEYEGVISSFLSFQNKPNKSILDYYYFDVSNPVEFGYNEDTIIQKADNETILNEGVKVDILSNQADMGEAFATKRIKRKASVYQDINSPLYMYVIYHNNEVIGNVEYLKHNDIIKIEDFDIHEPYQRKGHGSSVLYFMIQNAKKEGVKGIYMVTYNDDTPKQMYEKCGFGCIGKKTEIFFDFKKK